MQYLNYQDQIHDAIDGGYVDQHIPNGGDVEQGEDDVVPTIDADDIAAETAPQILHDQPPFPGGPLNMTLLSSYVEHVTLQLCYNSNNVSIIFKFLYAILIKHYINIFF